MVHSNRDTSVDNFVNKFFTVDHSYKMSTTNLPTDIQENYEIHEWKHACTILATDFPLEYGEICVVLSSFRLRKEWISKGGGSKSEVSKFIDTALYAKGWVEKKFDTKISVDSVPIESPTHSIDCFKNRIALEIEWNNKDPFF